MEELWKINTTSNIALDTGESCVYSCLFTWHMHGVFNLFCLGSCGLLSFWCGSIHLQFADLRFGVRRRFFDFCFCGGGYRHSILSILVTLVFTFSLDWRKHLFDCTYEWCLLSSQQHFHLHYIEVEIHLPNLQEDHRAVFISYLECKAITIVNNCGVGVKQSQIKSQVK